MDRIDRHAGTAHPIVATTVSAVMATLLTTGLLTAAIAVTAAVKGYGIGDLYARYFPISRGLGPAAATPTGFQVIFIAYVIVSAEIAIFIRRFMTRG